MGTRVLVVDDSPFMRTVMKNILIPLGFEIAGEAGNGAEAVQKYQATHPDLVTMDLVMPGVDGLAALRQIRTMDRAARVIMVSAAGQHSTVMQAMQDGASGYIVKPFQGPQVAEAIKTALTKQG